MQQFTRRLSQMPVWYTSVLETTIHPVLKVDIITVLESNTLSIRKSNITFLWKVSSLKNSLEIIYSKQCQRAL